MQRLGRWGTLSAFVVSIAVAACGSTSMPSPAPTPAPPASPAVGPTPTPATTPPAAVNTATWEPAGALALARAGAHAALLGDGRVLVVGNDNICTPGGAWDDGAAAEVYDPTTRTWAATASLNAPRTDFAALALPDGRVLVAGGLTSSEPADGVFGAYSSAKLYDPETGRWSATGLMNVARVGPASAPLADGRVLVAGGSYVDDDGGRLLASAEVYDPETEAWSRIADMPGRLPGARGIVLADGRVLVVSGDDLDGLASPGGGAVYDPATGTWAEVVAPTTPREGFSLVALPDGGALLAGGIAMVGEAEIRTTASAERLDPGTLRWSPTGDMITPAENRASIVLGDGRVLVAGGVSAGIPGDSPGPVERPAIADAEIYDPVSGTWTATTPLPEPRERGVFVTLADRTVLLVGGDAGYVGEASMPWCPAPIAPALRYVPGNLADFPKLVVQPGAAGLARSDVPRATAKPADAKEAAASITAFGIDLYRRMLKDGTLDPEANAVFSPTSIAMALGMARGGAKGTTATQMDEVLHTSGWTALAKGLNALDQALASREASWKDEDGTVHELRLSLANAAFAQRGWDIVEGYLDAIAATFGAGLRLVDYEADPEAARQLINAWVAKKTADRIPELIPAPVINGLTRLVLVNAIYLKANWERELRGGTEPRSFTRLDGSTVKVPTMLLEQGEQGVPLASGGGWKATELRYLGAMGRVGTHGQAAPLAMTLILPDDLRAFEQGLTAKALAGVVAKLDAQRVRLGRVSSSGQDGDCGTYAYSVRLFMPRFSIDTAAALRKPLASLGMPRAFDQDEADFSGIHVPETPSDRISVSEVVHQANIDVDEKGTEAAAATAVVMATGGCLGPEPAKTVTLRLDRPFLFLVRDVETGAILFMGRVVDPTAT